MELGALKELVERYEEAQLKLIQYLSFTPSLETYTSTNASDRSAVMSIIEGLVNEHTFESGDDGLAVSHIGKVVDLIPRDLRLNTPLLITLFTSQASSHRSISPLSRPSKRPFDLEHSTRARSQPSDQSPSTFDPSPLALLHHPSKTSPLPS